jgi:hypothetical protein
MNEKRETCEKRAETRICGSSTTIMRTQQLFKITLIANRDANLDASEAGL